MEGSGNILKKVYLSENLLKNYSQGEAKNCVSDLEEIINIDYKL